LILLAEEALSAGRHGEGEELIEEAYRKYDDAITNTATWWLSSEEEKVEPDLQYLAEPNQMSRQNPLLSTLIGGDTCGRHINDYPKVFMAETKLKASLSELPAHQYIDGSALATTSAVISTLSGRRADK
jgi:hypothetical protein